jgi:hypothetical protein
MRNIYFMDWNNAETPSFPKLKPFTQTISIRLPEPISNEHSNYEYRS